ncbi:MAG: molybdopterin-dependent oxidoreductase, partial [Candidatus Geothermarchaeales archaeon]
MSKSSRRKFLKASVAASAGFLLLSKLDWVNSAVRFLEPVEVGNPLAQYPERNWEEIYRDQYRYDYSFTFCCVPNDTHNCRLRAYVRNGILMRVEQVYNYHEAGDLLGNKAHPAWNPRGCLKGYTIMRRLYGPHRVKYPVVRKGFKDWVEAGFPTDENGLPPPEFMKRGEDEWIKATWDEALNIAAQGLIHIAQKYSGPGGRELLTKQGYPEEMIQAMKGAGTQTFKLRPGMALAGATRLLGMSRFANMMALLDAEIRGVDPDDALGGRIWSNYSWHGDLDPGTPMVTGVQTLEPEINDFRNSKLLVFMGKNMIENKMPEAHWWVELIEREGTIVNISPEYSPASQKANLWISIRPGTDVALFLAVANLLMENGWYEEDFVKKFTDLPLLVRGDTLKLARAKDVIPSYENKRLENYVDVQGIPTDLREEWGDFVVWDRNTDGPAVITRDDVGDRFTALGVDPALEGSFTLNTVDGKTVEAKPILQLYRELTAEYDVDTASDITGVAKEHIQQLAEYFATLKPAAIHTGEGTNHYFHNDLKDRVAWLIVALTGNVGKPGAGKGHWAGNYKHAVFGVGMKPYVAEDPFNTTLDPDVDGKDINVRTYYKGEEPCYWDYDERPLIVDTPRYGRKVFTGQTHMPTPSKVEWYVNVNHLNNSKWAYNIIANVHPKVEMIVYHDIEWTASCEYADVVFPAQAWPELTQPDMTASCSNPFLEVWKGGIDPVYDARIDHHILGNVAEKLSEITDDDRFKDYWKFVLEGRNQVYLQRILDAGSTTRGYNVDEILASDRAWLMMFRTYPRIPGYEQIQESRPYYNRTGRLEFYRDEDEFIEYGENLIVYREPVEATPYLPNVIVATHPWLRPDDYGIPVNIPLESPDYYDKIQVRNLTMPWSEVKDTANPLWQEGYRFYCLTPKTRHRVHSSWSTSDWNLIWDSNFGDPLRLDKRKPGVGEHQMHLNPEDAKELGLQQGDYVYVDANINDRPYIGASEDDPFYRISRLMLRVKVNPGYPTGVTMIKHSPYMATHKSVQAQEERVDGLALWDSGGLTGLANLRFGSQQSLTRGYLQPTMMTDSLVRKNIWGWGIGKGYEIDVHAPNTCPKETLVKISKAEDGGIGGVGKWEPGVEGVAPGEESEAMRTYL